MQNIPRALPDNHLIKKLRNSHRIIAKTAEDYSTVQKSLVGNNKFVAYTLSLEKTISLILRGFDPDE